MHQVATFSIDSIEISILVEVLGTAMHKTQIHFEEESSSLGVARNSGLMVQMAHT